MTRFIVRCCLILFFFYAAQSIAATWNPDKLWVTNGMVTAVEVKNDTLYLGGQFSYVGPPTGGAVLIDTITNEPLPFPRVHGDVLSAITDNKGGWYIGGRFTNVDDIDVGLLAHVFADGTLDMQWLPIVSGTEVRALLLVDDTLYIGGRFHAVNDQPRDSIAAIKTLNNTPSLTACTGTHYLSRDL